MLGADADGIDIGSRAVDTESESCQRPTSYFSLPVGTGGVDAAAGFRGDLLAQSVLDGYVMDELGHELGNVRQQLLTDGQLCREVTSSPDFALLLRLKLVQRDEVGHQGCG